MLKGAYREVCTPDSTMMPPRTEPDALPTKWMSCFIPIPEAVNSFGMIRDTSFVELDERLENPKLVNMYAAMIMYSLCGDRR